MNIAIFRATPKVYHYTKFENALRIILSNKLKFGKLSGMNDYIESKKIIGINYNHKSQQTKSILTAIDEYLSGIGQISLTNGRGKHGYDIEPMWSHYADNGRGACIILNRNKLMNIAKKHNCWKRLVSYRKRLSHWYVTNIKSEGEIESFFSQHRKSIFFEKSTDWKYEQEYRIICTNSKMESISLDDCIMGVVLFGSAMSSIEYNEKKNILEKLKVPVYTYTDTIFGGGEKKLEFREETVYTLTN